LWECRLEELGGAGARREREVALLRAAGRCVWRRRRDQGNSLRICTEWGLLRISFCSRVVVQAHG